MNIENTNDILHEVKKSNREEVKRNFLKCVFNKQFGSIINPELEAKIWADSFYDKDKEVFIVVGTGRLHYHKALMKKLNKNQQLFIIDWKYPLIANAIINYDENEFGENVSFRFSKDIQGSIFSIIGILDRFTTKKINFTFIPPYTYFYHDEVKEIETHITNYISTNRVILNTIQLFGIQWPSNMYKNIEIMINKGVPFKILANKFQGIPAIIVSAGPSLEKNIKRLAELLNKAVIIASGSAIDTLKRYNISPHFLASFDGGIGNYRHFENLDTKELRLIFTGEIYPQILEEFKGILIPAEASNKKDYDLYKEYGAPDLGEAMVGPSVANFALDIAVNLGCNPIIFIGQDLALADGKTHASGNAFKEEIKDLSNYIKVKGNIEDTVYTSRPWLTMLKFFERQIKNYSNIIINATEGGAFIEGTTVKTLKEVEKLYLNKDYNLNKMIEDMLGSNQKNKTDINNIKSSFHNDVSKLIELIDTTIVEIEKLKIRFEKNILGPKEKKKIKQLKRREDKLLNSLIYKHIIRSIIYGQILFYERYYTRLASEQPQKVEQWVLEYQNILFDSAKKALNNFLYEIEVDLEQG